MRYLGLPGDINIVLILSQASFHRRPFGQVLSVVQNQKHIKTGSSKSTSFASYMADEVQLSQSKRGTKLSTTPSLRIIVRCLQSPSGLIATRYFSNLESRYAPNVVDGQSFEYLAPPASRNHVSFIVVYPDLMLASIHRHIQSLEVLLENAFSNNLASLGSVSSRLCHIW